MTPLQRLRLLGTVEGLQHVEISQRRWSAGDEKVKTIKVETLDEPIKINLSAPILPISYSSGGILVGGAGAPPSQINVFTETRPFLHGSKSTAQPVNPPKVSILPSTAVPSTIPPTSENGSNNSPIYIIANNGSRLGPQIRRTSMFGRVLEYVAAKIGKPEDDIRLLYHAGLIGHHHTPNSLEMQHGEVSDVMIPGK